MKKNLEVLQKKLLRANDGKAKKMFLNFINKSFGGSNKGSKREGQLGAIKLNILNINISLPIDLLH